MSRFDSGGGTASTVGKSKIHNSRVEIRARFKTTCRTCGMNVYTGDICFYFPRTQAVEHYNCARRRSTTAGR